MSWLTSGARIAGGVATGGLSEAAIAGYNELKPGDVNPAQIDPATGHYGGQAGLAAQEATDIQHGQTMRSAVYNNTATANKQQMDQRAGDLRTMGQGFYDAGAAGADRADNRAYQYNAGAQQNAAMSGMDRGATIDALGRLQRFYQQGPGPSAAQAQLQYASDQTMAQNLAMARSGRGGDNGMAMRQAMFANAGQQQQLGQQQAMLRAQEEQNWRGQQLNAMGLEQNTLGAMRGQDISAMGTMANAGLGYSNLGQNYANMGMQGQLSANQLGLSAEQLGMGNQLDYRRLEQQGWLGSEGLRNQIYTTEGNAQLGAATTQAQLNQQAAMQNQQADEETKAAGMSMIGSGISAGLHGSDIRAKKDIEAEPFDDYIRRTLDASQARASRDTGARMNLRSVFAPEPEPAPRYDFRPAQGYSYRYKDPAAVGADGRTYYGPMAQDLEKTAAGRSAVVDTPRGKAVDTGRVALMNTAALSEQQRRIDHIMARLDELGGRHADIPTDDLDAAYERSGRDVGSSFGGLR